MAKSNGLWKGNCPFNMHLWWEMVVHVLLSKGMAEGKIESISGEDDQGISAHDGI